MRCWLAASEIRVRGRTGCGPSRSPRRSSAARPVVSRSRGLQVGRGIPRGTATCDSHFRRALRRSFASETENIAFFCRARRGTSAAAQPAHCGCLAVYPAGSRRLGCLACGGRLAARQNGLRDTRGLPGRAAGLARGPAPRSLVSTDLGGAKRLEGASENCLSRSVREVYRAGDWLPAGTRPSACCPPVLVRAHAVQMRACGARPPPSTGHFLGARLSTSPATELSGAGVPHDGRTLRSRSNRILCLVLSNCDVRRYGRGDGIEGSSLDAPGRARHTWSTRCTRSRTPSDCCAERSRLRRFEPVIARAQNAPVRSPLCARYSFSASSMPRVRDHIRPAESAYRRATAAAARQSCARNALARAHADRRNPLTQNSQSPSGASGLDEKLQQRREHTAAVRMPEVTSAS